ncbi:MAG: helix-turn-helix transcriptional regulator [Lautropia sp.]|nr:helix-turn-helix transcriptional regulator [Lautropia sp.]
MPKSTLSAFPSALKQLAALGERLRLARLRRKLGSGQFAERVGVSRETLRRMEKGDPTIAIGTWVRALRVLGLEADLDAVAADDELGRKLQDLDLLPVPRKPRRAATGQGAGAHG